MQLSTLPQCASLLLKWVRGINSARGLILASYPGHLATRLTLVPASCWTWMVHVCRLMSFRENLVSSPEPRDTFSELYSNSEAFTVEYSVCEYFSLCTRASFRNLFKGGGWWQKLLKIEIYWRVTIQVGVFALTNSKGGGVGDTCKAGANASLFPPKWSPAYSTSYNTVVWMSTSSLTHFFSRFDQVLFATALKLQSSSYRRMAVYRMIVRELGGQFYLMIAEYFYLCGHRMNKYSVMGKSNQLVRTCV